MYQPQRTESLAILAPSAGIPSGQCRKKRRPVQLICYEGN